MFHGNSFNVQGFEIPFSDPLFLTTLTIHIVSGLTCVVSGIVAMLSRKIRGSHSRAGTVYYLSLWVVFITASLIAFARWKEDYPIFILGAVSFVAAVTGKAAAKHKWKRWSIFHISGMGLSYIFLLMAFYVDNGRFLPVWKTFSPITYWLLPLIVGMPILTGVLFTSPYSRNYFIRKRV
jgi:hypothetical protein